MKVWDMILSFDGYSFCKAHSASYAQVSYRAAYLKRFYPLEFIASVINNGGGFYGRQTYIDECRRMGFPILPPDVNKSRWEYTAERGEGEHDKRTPGVRLRGPWTWGSPSPSWLAPSPSLATALRVGLGQLKDARKDLVEAIIAEREKAGPFRGFRDFLQRTSCLFEDIRVPIRSALGLRCRTGYTRPQLFFRWHNIDKEAGFGCPPRRPSSETTRRGSS